MEQEAKKTIIFGGGPAGLAAGLELVKNGQQVIVTEKDSQVGGISKTVNYKGYYFDVGGHRFFSKSKEVNQLWQEIMGQDFLKRPRLSRIYYNNKFFYYPLRPFDALKNIGLITAIEIFFSYAFTRLKFYLGPKREAKTFEEWVTGRFGKKLFEIFFKTYTEKVWGIPTSQIGAEWAAQRIKGLSLTKAIKNAIFPQKVKLTTLIDEFYYPRQGPGMMYEKMAQLITDNGGIVQLNTKIVQVNYEGNRVTSVVVESPEGRVEKSADYFISSMPLTHLIKSLNPQPPKEIIEAANKLRFRGLLTVELIIDKPELFPDNWIYIHSPEVKVGRIQNFKNWSPEMVPDQRKTVLGLEYFCFPGDKLWNMSDDDLIKIGAQELEKIKLGQAKDVVDGFVLKEAFAYPVYQIGYKESLEKIINYISQFKNLQIIGRGGMYRYNNMDHSILTGLYAARNIMGQNLDIFKINLEEEYHEAN